jgi:hypothetical protein
MLLEFEVSRLKLIPGETVPLSVISKLKRGKQEVEGGIPIILTLTSSQFTEESRLARPSASCITVISTTSCVPGLEHIIVILEQNSYIMPKCWGELGSGIGVRRSQ